MSATTMDEAIEALRKLPKGRQRELAPYIAELAREQDAPEDIDPAHLSAVLEGLKQIERGEIASDEAVAAAFHSFGE